MKISRVIQVVLNYFKGDGVGNCLRSIAEVLDKKGINNIICAVNISEDIADERVRKIDEDFSETVYRNDIVMYHFSIGCYLNEIIENLNCKKILVYQNVTPAVFWKDLDYQLYYFCKKGEIESRRTACTYDKCITPSHFSERCLIEYGWAQDDIHVIPIYDNSLISSELNPQIISNTGSSFNFLFTGRVVPNKRIDDILRVFNYYQKNINANSCLYIVGGIDYTAYFEYLDSIIKSECIENVVFTGRISQVDLESYYKCADVYISMSEHEGFCLPILEAMRRRIVVVAYASTAIVDTMGDAGILLYTKDSKDVCDNIKKIVSDVELRDMVISKQLSRVEQFNISNYEDEICRIVEETSSLSEKAYENFELTICDINTKLSYLKGKLFSQSVDDIVIYGMGTVGKKCYEDIKEIEGNNIKIIMVDNGLAGDEYQGHELIDFNTCVQDYREALFIITIQSCMNQILKDLFAYDIDIDHILLYDMNGFR